MRISDWSSDVCSSDLLITHPLLDAFTSYGTQLWWPLRPTPTSWSSIFIIDPFFTLPLFATVAAAFIVGLSAKARRALCWALGWCAAYLALSLGAQSAVEPQVRHAQIGRAPGRARVCH